MDISTTARTVLEARYLARDESGALREDVEGMFRRVADAVAGADANYLDDPEQAAAAVQASAERFYELMTSLEFLPNSPTLMNAGRPLGQLSACFVLPVGDSMEEIFEAVKNAALIHKSGGGTGFSFSRLRPAGSVVQTTGGVASGPVSFMRVFNMATEAVKQGGTRRGANMGILRVDHPDILSFIDCKRDNADITNFNISIGLTEVFMQAVEAGSSYELIDPRSQEAVGSLDANAVFMHIVEAAWQNGEPGVVFLDRLNQANVVPTLGEFEATNPCGEQPLLPFESCNLGSIDLSRMLKAEGEGQVSALDWDKLARTVRDAVHFLDNVIEINQYPLQIIADTTLATRKIGLGVMGFADMLSRLGIPYNSPEALSLADRVMAFINNVGHQASEQLAQSRGAFPLFEQSTYAAAGRPPLRNATVTTIAPTGTLSIIAGCSSGIEPVFAHVFIRRIMDGQEFVEVNPALMERLEQAGLASDELLRRIAEVGSIAHLSEIPESIRRVFPSAHDVSPEYHIRMQAAFQRHTDNAVSKTVNFASSATIADVADVFRLAHAEGCKGVTIYRDKSRESQVLNIGSSEPDASAIIETGAAVDELLVAKQSAAAPACIGAAAPICTGSAAPICTGAAAPNPIDEPIIPATAPNPAAVSPFGEITPRPRPAVVIGFTERMKIGCGNLYITVNFDENGICEVFTSTGKAGGCPSQSEATARLVSIALRSGISVEKVCEQLRGIRCPSTIRQDDMSCTSCPDAIAKVVMKVHRHIKEGGALMASAIAPTPLLKRSDRRVEVGAADTEASAAGGAMEPDGSPAIQQPAPLPGQYEAFCPECSAKLEYEGGCAICRNCGYSKCR